jgi:hypothetical protein
VDKKNCSVYDDVEFVGDTGDEYVGGRGERRKWRGGKWREEGERKKWRGAGKWREEEGEN